MTEASTQNHIGSTVTDDKAVLEQVESAPVWQNDSKLKNTLIKFSGMFSNKGEVTNIDTGEMMYTIKANKSLRTKLEFRAAGEESSIGMAKMHMTRADFELRGQEFSVKIANKLSTKYEYVSPTLQGQTLTWKTKCHMRMIEYILLDERQMPIARFEIDGLKWTSRGSKLEIVESYENNQAAMEEIVLTASTLCWYTLVVLWASIV